MRKGAVFLAVLVALCAGCGKLKQVAKISGLGGRVVDGSLGTPIRQAAVQLFPKGKTENPIQEATTDDDGRFAFGTLRPGEYEVAGSAAGYAAARTAVTIENEEPVDVVLQLFITADKYPEWSAYLSRKYPRAFLKVGKDVWVGTEGGLVRMIDGGSSIVYTAAEGLPSSVVLSLGVTEKYLWIGTDKGLGRFDLKTELWDVVTKEKNGIAGNKVTAIAVDPTDKRLWIATDEGVSKQDGHYWVNYHKGSGSRDSCNATGLPDNSVRAFVFEPGGRIWFATPGGAAAFSNNAWCWFVETAKQSGLLDSDVTSVTFGAPTASGTPALWFGTAEGVSTTDGCTWTSYSSFDDVSRELPPVGTSRCVIQEKSCDTSTLTFACSLDRSNCLEDPNACEAKGGYCNAFCELPSTACDLTASRCPTQKAICRKPTSLCSRTALPCLPDETACTAAGGKCQPQPIKCDAVAFQCSLPERECRSGSSECASFEAACVSSDVICTIPDRSCVFPEATCTGDTGCIIAARECDYPAERVCPLIYRAVNPNNLPSSPVRSLFHDSSGLWVGTDLGLSRFDGTEWAVDSSNLPVGVISGIGSDGSQILVGYERGAKFFKDSQWGDYPLPEGPISNTIEDVALHPDGSVWIATPKGVSHFQDGAWQHYGKEHGLSDLDVRSIAIDSEGTVWAGTRQGLDRFQDGLFVKFEEKLPSEDIRILSKDGDSGLYIGTNKGVVHFQRTQLRQIGTPEGLAGDIVTALLFDSSRTLWVATSGSYDPTCFCYAGGGVQRVEPGGKPESKGLQGSLVYDMAVDSKGFLWAATERGLFLYDGAGWTQATPKPEDKNTGPLGQSIRAVEFDAAGRAWIATEKGVSVTEDPAGRWTHFTQSEGLTHNDALSLAIRDREVWIGTKNGLSVYRPR